MSNCNFGAERLAEGHFRRQHAHGAVQGTFVGVLAASRRQRRLETLRVHAHEVADGVDHLTERKRGQALYLLHMAPGGPIIVNLNCVDPWISQGHSDALRVSGEIGACNFGSWQEILARGLRNSLGCQGILASDMREFCGRAGTLRVHPSPRKWSNNHVCQMERQKLHLQNGPPTGRARTRRNATTSKRATNGPQAPARTTHTYHNPGSQDPRRAGRQARLLWVGLGRLPSKLVGLDEIF